ncbi:hypothetical protein GCM10010448_68770 [Streptomyces glomeratus]|uniref:Uncharacterized protein n=1 Tax=Streptomyces glomeratus TaxID=284452 RepID=A0ABP6M4Y0_9ACTN
MQPCGVAPAAGAVPGDVDIDFGDQVGCTRVTFKARVFPPGGGSKIASHEVV